MMKFIAKEATEPLRHDVETTAVKTDVKTELWILSLNRSTVLSFFVTNIGMNLILVHWVEFYAKWRWWDWWL